MGDGIVTGPTHVPASSDPLAGAAPPDRTRGPASFSQALAVPLIREAADSLAAGERMIDGVVKAARNGRVFSHEELIAIQAGVYRYTQELDLASKLVDKATAAVRQTLQSQQ